MGTNMYTAFDDKNNEEVLMQIIETEVDQKTIDEYITYITNEKSD